MVKLLNLFGGRYRSNLHVWKMPMRSIPSRVLDPRSARQYSDHLGGEPRTGPTPDYFCHRFAISIEVKIEIYGRRRPPAQAFSTHNFGCERSVDWKYIDRALRNLEPVPAPRAPLIGIKKKTPWAHIPRERESARAARPPGDERLLSRRTRRAVLVSQVKSRRPEREDRNGR